VAACGTLGLQMQCVDPRDLMTHGGHGDFYPACSNTTQPYEPYPAAFAPRDEAQCTDAALDERSRSGPAQYGASMDLMANCATGPCRQGIFQWTLMPSGIVEVSKSLGTRGWGCHKGGHLPRALISLSRLEPQGCRSRAGRASSSGLWPPTVLWR
jgi:hypothetical protein